MPYPENGIGRRSAAILERLNAEIAAREEPAVVDAMVEVLREARDVLERQHVHLTSYAENEIRLQALVEGYSKIIERFITHRAIASQTALIKVADTLKTARTALERKSNAFFKKVKDDNLVDSPGAKQIVNWAEYFVAHEMAGLWGGALSFASRDLLGALAGLQAEDLPANPKPPSED